MLCEIRTLRELKTAWFPSALAEDRFEIWFQPVVDTSGHRILGYECLIRLCDDPRGEGENEKIRAGEEIFEAARVRNQAPLFDSHAMELAVRSAAAQYTQPRGGSGPGLFFVNILPCSVADPEVSMRAAMEALAVSGVGPENFVFEAVDSDLAGDSARLRALHDYVRKQGFGFALDNAGLGSNCFEMIRDLRPDYVKIDRRLIWNAEEPVYAATIRKLVELADRFGAQAIAVGVERQRMVENLWLLGVQTMQGYLFGRPSRQVTRPDARADPDLANLARALEPVPGSSLHNHESPLFADLN